MLPVIPQSCSGFGEQRVREELSCLTHIQMSQLWFTGISFCSLGHLCKGFSLKKYVEEKHKGRHCVRKT